ncbi:DNA methyltransferase [Methylobacterium durans]|uniref:class I SAM-dependent DNA methyltransferase n=1 Tax=Methylobacterium durans TaxID=2202825 RepID=UPI002AFEA363|nr:DNA methyltransferase [Methylobacterium durans]MEA1830935.1 DNA methyltransferase [Methylobacterium durans]
MNPTEIFEAIEAICRKPFDPDEFPYTFATATDNAQATVSKLRNGSTNKSDLASGVLLNKKFHYAPAGLLGLEATLKGLRSSKRTASAKPAILLTCDGAMIAAEHVASGDQLHCRFEEIGDHFGFFLPAAGKERYKAVEENPIDVKATGKLAKLYDALLRANPSWGTEARRHELSQLMTRLIFCMFAEDVGIFADDKFSKAIFNHAGNKGEEARGAIISAFKAMNLPKDKRTHLPAWTRDLEYVNGGLFAEHIVGKPLTPIDAPNFDLTSYRYLKDACALNWREINPDILGSMIQSVADAESRAELGMHYTSVPNIMKVIGPLFLDDIDAEIDRAWDKPKALRKIIDRMSRIRVFDPACGSGNFLVVSYRELRARETRILKRVLEVEGAAQIEMWSKIPITNFSGIELTDFAAETAKLALFIAEYQANTVFGEVTGKQPASLPLKDAPQIECGNALVLDWAKVCAPPDEDEEVFIVGNPPFAGAKNQTPEQKRDRNRVFESRGRDGYKTLDLVSTWFVLATDYINAHPHSSFALVATSSITQGRQVPALWPYILASQSILFAHRPFKWRNNAAANAAVDCVIVGVGTLRTGQSPRLYEGNTFGTCSQINGYLVSGPLLYVKQKGSPMFDLPQMIYGSMPNDGGALILSEDERVELIDASPEAERFIRPLVGTTELIASSKRFCLWIDDADAHVAAKIPGIDKRLVACKKHRLESDNVETVQRAEFPHRFWHIGGISRKNSIVVASASSEKRPVLPCDMVSPDVIASNLCFVIHDGPDWAVALITSRLHLTWISSICGKLEARYRYSSSLGWHTFPVPRFTADQLERLSASTRKILKIRYSHYPATIAELYDLKRMPENLKQAHKENDDLLEMMYIGRPFRNDTERLERLFRLYAARARQDEA